MQVAQDIDKSVLGQGGFPGEEEHVPANLAPVELGRTAEIDQHQFAGALVIGALFRAMAPPFFEPVEWYNVNDVNLNAFTPNTAAAIYKAAIMPAGSYLTAAGKVARTLDLAFAFQEYCKLSWFPHITWLRPLVYDPLPQIGTPAWQQQQQQGGNAADPMVID